MFKTKRLITKYDYDRIQKILNHINPHDYEQPVKILLKKFRKAKLIDPQKISSNIITMNTRFRLKNLGYGQGKEYALVFPKDSDPAHNKISVFDRIGSELLASEVGDVIHVQDREDAYFLIENITYQPEAAGDYHL